VPVGGSCAAGRNPNAPRPAALSARAFRFEPSTITRDILKVAAARITALTRKPRSRRAQPTQLGLRPPAARLLQNNYRVRRAPPRSVGLRGTRLYGPIPAGPLPGRGRARHANCTDCAGQDMGGLAFSQQNTVGPPIVPQSRGIAAAPAPLKNDIFDRRQCLIIESQIGNQTLEP
jgi:hypothetical protein